MVGQIKYLVHTILGVCVDADVTCDLGEGEHVAARAEFKVHDVLVEIDVGRLLHESIGVLD